jgi:uncharacterized protein (TIGR02300 family)
LTSSITRGKEADHLQVYRFCKRITVVKAELGTKRTCPSCAARFYDLFKNPIICPKCGVSFIAATLLPSKGDSAPAPVAKPRDVAPAPIPEEVSDVELVSLEDVEEGKVEEDETAAVADVDLGEEEAVEGEEEDTFLEEDEEENADVTGYLDSGPTGGKEDEEEP